MDFSYRSLTRGQILFSQLFILGVFKNVAHFQEEKYSKRFGLILGNLTHMLSHKIPLPGYGKQLTFLLFTINTHQLNINLYSLVGLGLALCIFL